MMENLLIFTDHKTGDKVGIYYNSWLSIIKGILIKYAHKSNEDINMIIEKKYYQRPENYYDVLAMSHELEYHWAMLGAFGEQYWLRGISSKEPNDYFEWRENYIKKDNLKEPFDWF